jgi:prophage maintenance system killer protein
VIALEVADLVVIASRTLGLGTGQVLDLLDADAAEIALARARPGQDPGDPADQAATLLCALVQCQPLRHGNKQVALAATLQFLALNGWDIDTDPPAATAAMAGGVAAGTLDTAAVASWLAPRLYPAVKEKSMRNRPALPLAERIRKATMRKQPTGRFQRFTDRARRVVYLAGEEARLLGHGYIGTEHLLLGLVDEGEGVAARALEALGVSLEEVRRRVIGITGHGHGQDTPVGATPFTPQAKRVLELSLREALVLGHKYIGTEHLLLGLLREEHGIAARLLTSLGADHERVREQVTALLRPGGAADEAVISEIQRLQREIGRLRGILRAHGIDPDAGTAQSA